MKTLIAQLHHLERGIFWCLAGVMVILAVLYMYLVAHSISEVLARTALERQIATLQSSVGDMELRYVGKKGTFNFETSGMLGYLEPTETIFVTKKTLTGNILSLRNEI